MVRLCSESSRPYSGRPASTPRRKRRERGSAMAPERLQESAEAVVPRATSRVTPEGLTTREGLNLAGKTRPSVVLIPGRRSRLAEPWAAITVAVKECCFVGKDCQEPPDADPHVRWCGRREGKPSRRPDSTLLSFPFVQFLLDCG